jgi:hypothetical protein
MALAKCTHPGCTCLPAPGMIYCSTSCELVEEENIDVPISCVCGHPGCDPRGRVRSVNPIEFLDAESSH